MISPMTPASNPQYKPVTPTSAKDCMGGSAATGIERATVGRIRTDHARIRALSGAPATRGLYMYEVVNACAKLGVDAEATLWNSRATTRDTVGGGSACIVTIHTSVTINTTRRTNSYVGPHGITLLAYSYWPKGEICACELRTAAAHGEFKVYDPGMSSVPARQWSASLVYRAAEALTGAGKINLVVFPDTENVTRKAAGEGWFYDSPYRSSAKKLAMIPGHSYTVTSTYNGGGWPRADGTTATGWHRVPGDLYAPGKDLR